MGHSISATIANVNVTIVADAPQAKSIPTLALINQTGFVEPLFVPTGGQSRKRMPRPERQERNKQAELTLE